MKINLEVSEVAAILRDWAQSKYKTHNINCDFLIEKTTFVAQLEIIMDEKGFLGRDDSYVQELMNKAIAAKRNVPLAMQEQIDAQAMEATQINLAPSDLYDDAGSTLGLI